MENLLKITVLVFSSCLLGTVTSRSMPPVRQNTLERMNMKRSELKQMCDAKGETLYEDIRTQNIAFTLNLTERFMTWKKEASSTEDVYKLVQERCNKDSTLKEMLKKFVESSQLCMEEKDRLKDDKLLALTSRLMELFCAQYTHSNAYSSDEGCLNLVTNAAIDGCKEKYKTDQFIPLPFIYNIKECNDYQKYSECRLEAMKNCKDSTKSAVEAADSITFHTFYGCHNISVIPEKITMKRSIVIEKGEAFRFQITKRDLEEKCFDENEKIQYAVIDFLIKNGTQFELIESEIRENCLNSRNFKRTLNHFYEKVELCVAEENRFDERTKAEILRESLELTCNGVIIALRRDNNDNYCDGLRINPSSSNSSVAKNRHAILGFKVPDIPLPFIYTPEDCSNLYALQDADLEHFKSCTRQIKLEYQSRFNDLRRFYGCRDLYSSTEPKF